MRPHRAQHSGKAKLWERVPESAPTDPIRATHPFPTPLQANGIPDEPDLLGTVFAEKYVKWPLNGGRVTTSPLVASHNPALAHTQTPAPAQVKHRQQQSRFYLTRFRDMCHQSQDTNINTAAEGWGWSQVDSAQRLAGAQPMQNAMGWIPDSKTRPNRKQQQSCGIALFKE